MKIVLKSKLLSIVLLFVVGNVSAQRVNVVNEGDLSVERGTSMTVIADFDNKESASFINDGEVSFHYDFKNDGLVDFTLPKANEYGGYTKFIGDTVQTISGMGLTEFYDVLFKNPRTNLTGMGVVVSGNVEFVEGIVHNEKGYGGIFSFAKGATHSDASDFSYIEGQVDNINNEEEGYSFVFPTGDEDGFYRPSVAAGSSLVDNEHKSQYFFENSDIPSHPHSKKDSSIEVIDNQEYWKKTSPGVETPDIALSLTWDDRTTSKEVLEKKQGMSLKIVRWDENRESWVVESSAVDVANKTVTAAIRGYGIFTLARVLDEEEDDIVVYNGVSPDGDGVNDYFYISGLDKFADNTLEIYNRWGSKVFQTSGYGVDGNWFRGISTGKGTVGRGEKLPTGTYFYVLEYRTRTGKKKDKAGYLYIN